MEQNDVLAEPAHPLDVTRWVDRRTEHAGRRGLQSHELRYTLAAERSVKAAPRPNSCGWPLAVLRHLAATHRRYRLRASTRRRRRHRPAAPAGRAGLIAVKHGQARRLRPPYGTRPAPNPPERLSRAGCNPPGNVDPCQPELWDI